MKRRRFGAWFSLAVVGVMAAPLRVRVVRRRIVIADLPDALDGLRLAHITDTHFGPLTPAGLIRGALDAAIALEPDLFILTGDYVSADARRLAPALAQIASLVRASSPDRPPIAVLGNHDWDTDGPACAAGLRDLGVRVIDNDRVFLDGPPRALVERPTPECLCIAGVGDLWKDRVDLRAALDGVAETIPRLLLSHHPDAAEHPAVIGSDDEPPSRVDLMISGHLHGGQVRLPIIGAPIVPSAFGRKYLAGVVPGPRCVVAVSRGVGMSVLPVRLGAPPEIVELTLVQPA